MNKRSNPNDWRVAKAQAEMEAWLDSFSVITADDIAYAENYIELAAKGQIYAKGHGRTHMG